MYIKMSGMMRKNNTVVEQQQRYWHLPIAHARTADSYAARALRAALERKARTESALAELGLTPKLPLEELVKQAL
jgi:hypothetical protein